MSDTNASAAGQQQQEPASATEVHEIQPAAIPVEPTRAHDDAPPEEAAGSLRDTLREAIASIGRAQALLDDVVVRVVDPDRFGGVSPTELLKRLGFLSHGALADSRSLVNLAVAMTTGVRLGDRRWDGSYPMTAPDASTGEAQPTPWET